MGAGLGTSTFELQLFEFLCLLDGRWMERSGLVRELRSMNAGD